MEKLLEHHAPSKILSELPPETRAMAEAEAKLLLEVLDGLRPPDIMVLANRQIERISAWARQQQIRETVAWLKEEIELARDQHEHLKTGLQWAVAELSTRILAPEPEV
jgi:predicted RecB family nuclease